ncbi:MAG TPA: glutamyl-tRNA reductase [Candidatus Xenobia bacterium]|nr:glutamyl-tRNA reductase [Candidatus Xenobia bacterium]
MEISLVGLSHHTAPIEVRERVHFPEGEIARAVEMLRARPGVAEAALLSTCNRTEALLRLEPDTPALPLVADFLADARRMRRSEFESYLYHHSQRDAVRHIFRVASSLDAMVIGEPQVLGQVKAAYATARAVGSLGGVLDEVLTHAFAVAKKVRTETAIGASAVSVSYAAVELARKIFGSLEGRTVFLIGAGKMSELAAKHLRRSGAQAILVTNRTYGRAIELAEELGGQPIKFDDLVKYAGQADIVISSTGAPHHILRKQHGEQFLAERRNRPMFFIDIAVPRDIDPAMNELDNMFVYDIDDLKGVVDANRRERQREAQRAEEIVDREVDRFLARLKRLELTPTILALQEKLHGLREQELARARLKDLTPEQRAAVEEMSRSLVNKILHMSLTQLKRLPQEPDGLKLIEFIRQTFQLKD